MKKRKVMTMTPDYARAAALAMQTLIDNKISRTPVSPLPILKRVPGVLVLSFAEVSGIAEIDRDQIVDMSGEYKGAVTFYVNRGKARYIVAYNQQLPYAAVQRALARELGHIVLGHDGTRPADVRDAEALCFAHHLLCPRPLIHAVAAAGIPLTVEVVGTVTGCYDRCLADMRLEPAVRVPADLNRAVRDQFREYLRNYLDFQRILSRSDDSAPADFGHYMDGYEEGE